MYTSDSINLLVRRIKWRAPFGELATILESDLIAKENEKAYQDGHELVTLEDIFYSQPTPEITKVEFNLYLRRMVLKAVNRVLEDVFDSNLKADYSKKYDDMIAKYQSGFDKSLMLAMAVQVLQLSVTTQRVNINVKQKEKSYQKLKIELEGTKNDNGKITSVGLKYQYLQSVKALKAILFPKVLLKPKINGVDRW